MSNEDKNNFLKKHQEETLQEKEKQDFELKSTKKFLVFRTDPAFPVTAISLVLNFTMSNMLLYGITGKPKGSYLVSLATIPITLFFSLRDAQKDFENWEKAKRFRERKFPSTVIPYKVRYDWTDYEEVIITNKNRKLHVELDLDKKT